MALFRCSGGGKHSPTITEVTATDFPDLFNYIDVRDNSYAIVPATTDVCAVFYTIVTKNTYSASWIEFRDGSGNVLKRITAPTSGYIITNCKGLQIHAYSTVADSDLHFSSLLYIS